MKKEFIEKIRLHHDTQEGLTSLYNAIVDEEQQAWKQIEASNINNWTTLFEQRALTTPDISVVIETQNATSYTYFQLLTHASKIKDFIFATTDEHHIGLHYHNSFDFLVALIGINQAGRIAILFNTREPQERLIALAQQTQVKMVLGDPIGTLEAFCINEIYNRPFEKPRFGIHSHTIEDPAFVIFTSGTSGHSKAALFSHRRMIGAGVAWGLRTAMEQGDRCYIPLPLYHGNGLAVAFCAVIYTGATAVVRPRFSVSGFLEDIRRFECTHAVYIGELWRYLLNSDEKQTDAKHTLKVIFGNGLTRSLWESVVSRFGIEHIVEHFGATEMPAGALTNWFDIAGYCGYLPLDDSKNQEMVLVDENMQPQNDQGEALFVVPNGEYRGYMESSLNETKVVRNLFREGDLWWRSGDLLRKNAEGFYTFVERLGDTYRFKGENVACVDVEEAIRQCGKFEEVVVYGVSVPYIDGKIGMASLVTQKPFGATEANQLLQMLKPKLASYALPLILKIEHEKHITTATLKIQKQKLAKEGLERFESVPHFVLLEEHYVRLDNLLYTQIIQGKITLGIRSKI